MSLNLYFRECLSADKKALVDTGHFNVLEQISKLYLSEDKRFAGMVVGMIPNGDNWKSIRNHVDGYVVESKIDSLKAKKSLIKKLDVIFSDIRSSSSLFFVVGDLMMIYTYEDDSSVLRSHNPDVVYAAGSGMF